MFVPDGRQSIDDGCDVSRGHNDIDVDHGLGCKSRNGSAANVLDTNGELSNRPKKGSAKGLELLRPTGIVANDDDGALMLVHPVLNRLERPKQSTASDADDITLFAYRSGHSGHTL